MPGYILSSSINAVPPAVDPELLQQQIQSSGLRLYSHSTCQVFDTIRYLPTQRIFLFRINQSSVIENKSKIYRKLSEYHLRSSQSILKDQHRIKPTQIWKKIYYIQDVYMYVPV